MKFEKILKEVPELSNVSMDRILFEEKYPVLFTCTDGKEVFLFICCLVNAEKVTWIGTKTTYEILIQLLENEITIREAFLSVPKDKFHISYDGRKIEYKIVPSAQIQEQLLPTEGEYMDAEEGEYGLPALELPPFEGEYLE